MIYASIIVYALAIVLTLLFSYKLSKVMVVGEKMRVQEPTMTLGMAIAVWLLGGIISYYSIVNTKSLITNATSLINTSIFISLSGIVGGLAVLYTIVKKVIITEHEVVYINIFGIQKSLEWDDIKETKSVIGKRVKLIGNNEKTIEIGGNTAQMKRFVELANLYMPNGLQINIFL